MVLYSVGHAPAQVENTKGGQVEPSHHHILPHLFHACIHSFVQLVRQKKVAQKQTFYPLFPSWAAVADEVMSASVQCFLSFSLSLYLYLSMSFYFVIVVVFLLLSATIVELVPIDTSIQTHPCRHTRQADKVEC